MKHLLTAAAILVSLCARGQVALKTNLLYDAATTPNAGIEVGVGGKSTVNIVYGLNAWKYGSNSKGDRFAKHWVVMPEYRWWPCTRFNGHFIGVHAMGGELNATNVNVPLPGGFVSGPNIVKEVKDNRFQGPFLGAGITYGYQWSLSRHWNIEAEIGAGYAHLWYDKYPCGECGDRKEKGGADYLGLTKLGVSLMYVF